MPLIRRDVKRWIFIGGIYLINWRCAMAAGNGLYCKLQMTSGNKFQTVNFAQCQSAGSYQSYPISPFQSTAAIEYP